MTASTTTSGNNGDTFVAAYEELRRNAISRSICTAHFGLVLLLREGVAAWMARGSACAALATPAAAPGCPAAPIMTEELNTNIVGVLASMAMASRKEMPA